MIVLAGMSIAAYFVTVVALSVLVTLLLEPVRTRLVARGGPNWLALLTCLALYLIALAITGVLLFIGLADFVRDLDAHTAELDESLTQILPPALAADLVAVVAGAGHALVAALGSGIAVIGYSVIVVAYLLLEADRADQRILWAARGSQDVLARARLTADRLRSFVLARAVLGLVAAILDTILLVILGVPSALLWGILSFVLSFIPNIGFILALIPPTLLGLAVGGPWVALAVIVGYSVINVTIDYVLQPRYIGTSVNLSALVVTLSIIFWGVVLGPAGALLAIPMTIVAVAIADAFDDSRPLARLLVEEVGVPD